MTAQTSTQAQVISKFGEQKKAFSIDKHKQLIVTAKSMSDLNQAKRYLYGYFILYFNPHGVFMWQSEIKNLEHIPDKNISKLIHPITKVFYTQSEQGLPQKVEFNINKWFMIEYNANTLQELYVYHHPYQQKLENDDRRTVFLDVSPSRKEDLKYFKNLVMQ
ncbi:hypothetical protein GLOIN_2v1880406 [Rhizophagus irregularis DAOM 181602=DAOM 197198]|nr:hypothetical protein GLOIN_2v1880406 [Rhizophagus irregularis DAOM 181602=DAOM 197198]